MLPIALLVGSIVAWAAAEGAVSTREPHAHLPREVATGIALLAVHAAAIAEHLVRGLAPSPVQLVAGGALVAAGIALRVAAIRALGPAFVSTTTRPTRVVVSGPYRFLRHPSELGLCTAAVGAAVLLASVVAAAVIAIALVPLVVVRCAAEERTISRWAR